MSQSSAFWSRRTGRRGFLTTAGVLTGAAALAAACGGGDSGSGSGSTPSGSGSPAAGGTSSTPATSGSKVTRGGTATVVMGADPTTLDPTRNQDVFGSAALALVTDALFQIDGKSNIVPRLTEKYENPTPNTYVFTLRKGVKYHDGSDFTAESVKFNLERHINDAKSVRNSDVKDVTAIETPDASTVRLTLKAPFAPFLGKLASPGAGTMLSSAVVTKLGDSLQRDLSGAGTGPYKFTEWKKDTQIVLDRNESHWGKDGDGGALPYLDKYVFKPIPDENVRLTNLKSGDADFLLGNPPYKDIADLKKDSSLQLKEVAGLGWSFAMMNTEKEPFNNPAARRAFSYAIDREQIRKTVFFENGKVLDSPIPETVPWAYESSNRPYLKRDIAKAKEELTKAGKPSGFKFTVQIQNNSPIIQQTAELMKDQIKDAGLQMDIQLVEFGTLVQNANGGNYEAGLLGWSGGVDPDNNLYNLFYTKAGFNLSKYSNPQLDKLLDDGRTTLDQAGRAAIYKQAVKIVLDDQPFFMYFNPPQLTTARKNMQNLPQNYNGYWGSVDYDKVFKQK